MFDVRKDLPQSPLYDTSFEHDACGIGCCVNIKGKKSHETVNHALPGRTRREKRETASVF